MVAVMGGVRPGADSGTCRERESVEEPPGCSGWDIKLLQELPGASRSPPRAQQQLRLSGTIVAFAECVLT